MAKKDFIEDWRGRIEYVDVYRDNYSCRKRFKYHEEEAEIDAYFNHLQFLDNQEVSIQKQNQIAEQLKRQNDLSEQQLKAQNHLNHQTFPRPIPLPTQKLDPEYEEWLRYKKATDPEFKKWKAEEARKKAEQQAEIRRQQAVKEEAERKRREEERKIIEEEMRRYEEKKEKEEKERKEKILSEIKPFESQIINGEDVSLDVKSKVARYTINQAVIDILKETDIERILRKLRENEFLNFDDEAYIKKKQSAIRKAKEQKRKLEKEKQLKITQEKKNNSGCAGILLLLIIPSLLSTLFFVL